MKHLSSKLVLSALVAAALAALLAPAAHAAFGFSEFEVSFTEPNGSVAVLAGSHPDAMTTTLEVNTLIDGEGNEAPDEEVKDLFISQAEGLAGNPTATPRCSEADFIHRVEGRPSCPDATAVGVAAVKASFQPLPPGLEEALHVAVYNLVPPPGVPAELGFIVMNEPVTVNVGLSPEAPYRLVAELNSIPQVLLFLRSELTLWGNPASPSHNTMRGNCLGEPLGLTHEAISLGSCPVTVPEEPFLTLPRSCQAPLTSAIWASSWGKPTVFTEPLESQASGLIGCEELGFAPAVGGGPSTTSAESSSGIDVDVDVDDPGLTSITGRAMSDIKRMVIALPPGVTANPSAAEGLGVCSKAQYEAVALGATGCPESSKLGTIEAETPILENHTLRGPIYLAEPDNPATSQAGVENPFDSLLALYIVIRDPELGILIKLPARIDTDASTGQIVTTVDGLPQFPLNHVRAHLRSGPRAALVTPPSCGQFTTRTTLTPWSGGSPVESNSTFTISSGPGGGACPSSLPFGPGFQAGAISNAAGRYSPFTMRITRKDGEQDITRFSAKLPAGEVAKIAGVPTCPDTAIEAAKLKTGRQELASPSCPADSQIGTVLAGAGVGSALTYVPGSIYLAGPYGGDQLSVVAIVPAVAGPFDVGTVVTREALALDPETGEAEVDGAASDPIPHILKGIPLKLRDLRIMVDRPQFTLNPTSCKVLSTRARISGSGQDPFQSSDDTLAEAVSRYQASSCASLGFKPNLKIQLSGATRRAGHPQLRSVVTYPKGGYYANVGKAVVTLPHSEFVSPEKVGNACTRPQFAEGTCPPSTRLGFAKAWTPLLDKPLEGPVYFRSNGGVRDIPDLAADLHGQFHVVLLGAVDSVDTKRQGGSKAKIRTTFLQVPDAPVSRFELTLKGGPEGAIENSANLCAVKRYVKVGLTGQNGRKHDFRTPLAVKCRDKKKQRSSRAR